jgi:hypothetical protein
MEDLDGGTERIKKLAEEYVYMKYKPCLMLENLDPKETLEVFEVLDDLGLEYKIMKYGKDNFLQLKDTFAEVSSKLLGKVQCDWYLSYYPDIEMPFPLKISLEPSEKSVRCKFSSSKNMRGMEVEFQASLVSGLRYCELENSIRVTAFNTIDSKPTKETHLYSNILQFLINLGGWEGVYEKPTFKLHDDYLLFLILVELWKLGYLDHMPEDGKNLMRLWRLIK